MRHFTICGLSPKLMHSPSNAQSVDAPAEASGAKTHHGAADVDRETTLPRHSLTWRQRTAAIGITFKARALDKPSGG